MLTNYKWSYGTLINWVWRYLILNPGAAGKIHLRGCNLHTKVCKCNSSIKNLKFDQIVPFFPVLPKNDTAHFDHMFDLIDGNLFDLKRAKDPSLYQIQIEWGIKSASNYLKILLVGLLEIEFFYKQAWNHSLLNSATLEYWENRKCRKNCFD